MKGHGVDGFGWIADGQDLPTQWDLRRCGWTLRDDAAGAGGAIPLLLDARRLDPPDCEALLVDGPSPARRVIALGVEDGGTRAALLALGCGEALPAAIPLPELAVRARRVAERDGALPRLRKVGPLLLDLFHRDARRDGAWLSLHPREFAVLWRLADQPGERVTRRMLLSDVWRLQHEPETNSVEVHVSRLRGKLALAGCADLIRTVPTGGYRLDLAAPAEPPLVNNPLPRLVLPARLPATVQGPHDEG